MEIGFRRSSPVTVRVRVEAAKMAHTFIIICSLILQVIPHLNQSPTTCVPIT